MESMNVSFQDGSSQNSTGPWGFWLPSPSLYQHTEFERLHQVKGWLPEILYGKGRFAILMVSYVSRTLGALILW